MKFALFQVAAIVLAGASVEVKNAACSQAVSVVSGSNNDYCMKLCDEVMTAGKQPADDAVFAKSCSLAHYTVNNGHAIPNNACFDSVVYGYSEGSQYDSIVPNLYTATPALCQLECQDNDQCVQFAWASELVSAENTRTRCLLKSEKMVKGALNQKTNAGDVLINGQYCSLPILQSCSAGWDCLKCNGSSTCAWNSAVHVSGWKQCAVPQDYCAPAPEYPVCKQYASIDPATLNSECFAICNVLMSSGGLDAVAANEAFNKKCAHEHYDVGISDSHAHPTGKCFNNVIVGYAEGSEYASMADAQDLITDTPAECQLECQKRPDCAAFSFVTEALKDSNKTEINKCLLKSKEMVAAALKIDAAAEHPIVDPKICSIQIPQMCKSTYDCISCAEGTMSCAWNSVYHVSGRRHCGSVVDICQLQ